MLWVFCSFVNRWTLSRLNFALAIINQWLSIQIQSISSAWQFKNFYGTLLAFIWRAVLIKTSGFSNNGRPNKGHTTVNREVTITLTQFVMTWSLTATPTAVVLINRISSLLTWYNYKWYQCMTAYAIRLKGWDRCEKRSLSFLYRQNHELLLNCGALCPHCTTCSLPIYSVTVFSIFVYSITVYFSFALLTSCSWAAINDHGCAHVIWPMNHQSLGPAYRELNFE